MTISKNRKKNLGAVFGLIILSLFLPWGCFQTLEDVAMVKRFRVMAISVNPPEIRPEMTTPTRVSVLWRDPRGNNRPVSFAWVVCQGEVSANSGYQNCEPLDPALVPVVTDATDGGDQLTIPPIPEKAFAEIPSGSMVKATVIVLACAGGTLPAASRLLNFRDDPDITKLCIGGDGIAAYKTFKIANGHTYNDAPNTSPVIQSVHLNDQLMISDEAASEETIPGNSANCSNAGCETTTIKLKVTFAPQTFQSSLMKSKPGANSPPFIGSPPAERCSPHTPARPAPKIRRSPNGFPKIQGITPYGPSPTTTAAASPGKPFSLMWSSWEK